MNEASLLGLGWLRLTTSSSWSCQFRARYFSNNSIWNPENSIYESCISKAIGRLSSFLQSGCKWKIGDGRSVSIRYDLWLSNNTIVALFPQLFFPHLDKISTLINGQSWQIPDSLPKVIKQCLQPAYYLPLPPQPELDFASWWANPSGILSIKETWNTVRTPATSVPWLKLVWNQIIRLCVSTLIWSSQEKLTQAWAKSIGVNLASRCVQ